MGLAGRLSVGFSHNSHRSPTGLYRWSKHRFSPDDGLIDANKHRLETIHPSSLMLQQYSTCTLLIDVNTDALNPTD